MDNLLSLTGSILIGGGVFFLITGAIGLVRLPDLFTRLHAVTKADTVGLGLVVAGLACHSAEWQTAVVLLLVWLLVMTSGAVNCQLLARYGVNEGSSTHGSKRDGDR